MQVKTAIASPLTAKQSENHESSSTLFNVILALPCDKNRKTGRLTEIMQKNFSLKNVSVSLERFSFDVEMVTRKRNANNKQTNKNPAA